MVNFTRFILLTYEALLVISDKSRKLDDIRSTTISLVLSDLPTLFLMSSITLFIYYIGTQTVNMEEHQKLKGLYLGKDSIN